MSVITTIRGLAGGFGAAALAFTRVSDATNSIDSDRAYDGHGFMGFAPFYKRVGLCSTAYDYYKFCQMMLNNGRFGTHRLLSRKSSELMVAPHVALTGSTVEQGVMGLGLGVNGRPGQVHELGSLSAYGWGGFFYTRFIIDPKEDINRHYAGPVAPGWRCGLERTVLYSRLPGDR